jgi:hypothetical protein
MIKELWNFLRYSWQTIEGWAKLLIFTVILQISAVFFAAPWNTIIQGTAWMIMVFMVVTFWTREYLIPKWHKYKQHRNHLLTTIKHSEHD